MSKAFISKVLGDIDAVKSHAWQDDGLCQIDRGDYNIFTVGFVWQKHVKLDDISPILELQPQFIASVPSGAFWDGDAIQVCEEKGIGWGGIGTFRSACHSEDPASVTEKTTEFARRIIRQHPNVRNIVYVNSFSLTAHTKTGAITIALDDSYDMTGDSVRTSWDKLQPFDVLFKNNPNGSVTADARDAAESLGVEIADAKSIFKKLWKH
tara:strand:- start:48 stop:674 length:627 start_codon:yes stop_codon:yes gene_type:complete